MLTLATGLGTVFAVKRLLRHWRGGVCRPRAGQGVAATPLRRQRRGAAGARPLPPRRPAQGGASLRGRPLLPGDAALRGLLQTLLVEW